MTKRSLILLVVILVFTLFLAGCGEGGIAGLFATATATPNMTATQKAEDKSHTETAEAVTATYIVEATGTSAAEATITKIFMGTSTAYAKETLTAEAQIRKTETASGMYERVLGFYDDGYLKSTEGLYFELDDFRNSMAQMYWFRRWDTDYSPEDFVVSADITYESASATPEWRFSGCGFVFRADFSGDNFYAAFFAMDGKFYIYRWLNGTGGWPFGSGYYGKIDVPKGTVHIDIIAQGDTFHMFVNDTHVLTRSDKYHRKGELQYTIISGTNKDYGIRCIFDNVELWELE